MSGGKKRRSLSKKAVHFTVMNCIVFGIVAQIVGLTFYAVSFTNRLVTTADSAARQAAMSATHGADAIGFSKSVMQLYFSLSEEEKEKVGTNDYRELFSQIDTANDGNYRTLLNMLSGTKEYHNVYAVYIAMYDPEMLRIVYIVDADDIIDGQGLKPGDWEPVNQKGMNKFLDYNGKGKLYDIDFTENYGLLCTVGVPLMDESGEIISYMLVDISAMDILLGMLQYSARLLLALIAVTILLAWIQTRRIKKGLVEPINRIAQASVDYVQDRADGILEKEHFSDLDIHSGDEIENLGNMMAIMERELSEYEKNLTKITAEKERISTELYLATQIQQSMIPHVFPPFPGKDEFDIYASMEAAREVGGDFYDYFLTDEDHLCIVMADVSGKGIPAALFMMVSKVIIQSCAMLGKSAGETLTRTNEAICSKNQTEMFVTVWLGILEISTGILTAANAGHEYPVIKRAGGQYELYKDKHGLVIGGIENLNYSEYIVQLKKGDRFFLYTDGVPEAADKDNKMFGVERMLEALNNSLGYNLQDTLASVRRAVSAFVKDAEQFDDLTMLCLEYRGK